MAQKENTIKGCNRAICFLVDQAEVVMAYHSTPPVAAAALDCRRSRDSNYRSALARSMDARSTPFMHVWWPVPICWHLRPPRSIEPIAVRDSDHHLDSHSSAFGA